MSETLTKINEITEQITALIAERRRVLKEGGSALISEMFAPFFEFPGIYSLSWTQYTPYFNDGEPCEFSVSADYMEFNGYTDDDYDDDDDDDEEEGTERFPKFSDYDLRGLTVADEPRPSYQSEERWAEYVRDMQRRAQKLVDLGWTAELAKNFNETLSEVASWMNKNEEALEELFGDHVRVTVSRTGIDVDDYDHD